MAKRQQRWTPDTCERPGCKVIVEFDDADLDAPHTLISIEQRCSAHANLFEDAETYAAILAENQRKNAVVNEVVTTLALTLEDVTWAFDAARALMVTIDPKAPTAETQVSALRESFKRQAAGQPAVSLVVAAKSAQPGRVH